MFIRQRVLLHLLASSNGPIPRERLFKLAFLYAHDGPKKPPAASAYQFLPGRRGPYSFTLRRELRELAASGFLRVLPGRELSLPGAAVPASAALPDGLLRLVRDFSWVYSRLTLVEMDKLIYGSHPRFTHKGALLLDLWAFRPRPAKYAVYTAGCAGWQVDGFLDLLLRHDIRSLVDVRADPASGHYGFDRLTLARICRRTGIRYCHLSQWSAPSAPDPAGDFEQFLGRHPRRIPCAGDGFRSYFRPLKGRAGLKTDPKAVPPCTGSAMSWAYHAAHTCTIHPAPAGCGALRPFKSPARPFSAWRRCATGRPVQITPSPSSHSAAPSAPRHAISRRASVPVSP